MQSLVSGIKAEESSIMLSGKGFGANLETRGLEIL
jgi:hypothetical protein